MLGSVTDPANALVFVFSESMLEFSTLATAAMMAAAGIFGICGLDQRGRHPRRGQRSGPVRQPRHRLDTC
jgi:hypothetical protein